MVIAYYISTPENELFDADGFAYSCSFQEAN